jgi:adenylyl cyclase CyaB, putative
MREIEIKARCRDHAKLIESLKRQGVDVSDPVTQDDKVYGLPGEKGDNINTAPWLRVRTETKHGETTSILTLKKTVTNQLDSIEHETIVHDADEATQIILQLGFEPYIAVKKTRQKAMIGDIELCIDHVDGLGVFVEAEKLTDENADYDTVVAELWTVFEKFGITKDDQVTDGYDVLIRQKEGIA